MNVSHGFRGYEAAAELKPVEGDGRGVGRRRFRGYEAAAELKHPDRE